MLEHGIIEKINRPYINPVNLAIKKSNEVRLLLVARLLNDITIPDYQCNRSVSEILSKAKRINSLN